MTVSTLYKLLDKMETIIFKGVPVPLTSFVIVNNEKMLDVVDKISASIPGEIQEARAVLQRAESVQQEAQTKANQMLAEAQQRSERILSESELLKAVQQEAERIRQQVIADCEVIKKQAMEEAENLRNSALRETVSIREGADQYAEAVLSNLDKDLTELHEIVRNGQRHLAQLKAESVAKIPAPPSPEFITHAQYDNNFVGQGSDLL